jgi:hypothetical protein
METLLSWLETKILSKVHVTLSHISPKSIIDGVELDICNLVDVIWELGLALGSVSESDLPLINNDNSSNNHNNIDATESYSSPDRLHSEYSSDHADPSLDREESPLPSSLSVSPIKPHHHEISSSASEYISHPSATSSSSIISATTAKQKPVIKRGSKLHSVKDDITLFEMQKAREATSSSGFNSAALSLEKRKNGPSTSSLALNPSSKKLRFNLKVRASSHPSSFPYHLLN